MTPLEHNDSVCPASASTMPAPNSDLSGWPWTSDVTRFPERMDDGAEWPRISIVTPSYNHGQFLEETIRSVLLQGYPNLEYIVIDGDSDDHSVEIIRKYAPWIAYWVSEADGGQSSALNKGFSHATGDIFAYINSDDVYCPGAFRQVAQEFVGQTNLPIIVNFSGLTVDEQRQTNTLSAHMSRPQLHVWLCSDACLFQQSTFWTRELHERVGGFNESLHFCLDKEFFLKAMYEVGKYRGRDGEPVAMFRHHASSKTATMEGTKWQENAMLWHGFRNAQPYVGILAEEYQRLSASHYLKDALSNRSRIGRLSSLARAVQCRPQYLLTRFYWGAVKKYLLELWQ